MKAMVELDSLDVVRLINENNNCYHPKWAVILDIRELMNGFRTLELYHVHREENVAADWFAKLGNREQRELETLIPRPPPEMEDILVADWGDSSHLPS
ncbi:hypothetical protein LINPERHAP2_LOCUS15362 [Linum perenne]